VAFQPGPGEDLSTEPPRSPIRRTLVLISLTGFAALVLLGGVMLLLSGDRSLSTMVTGSILVLVGLPMPVWAAAWLFRAARRFSWSQRSRCEHCGYSAAGLHSATCPECGSPLF
jgi:hypothetical protein